MSTAAGTSGPLPLSDLLAESPPGGSASALAVCGLGKRYGSVIALEGVELTVGSGELVGLVGANGAGKSTLMKIACGLVRPSTGTARIFGAHSDTREARRMLGYLAELFRFPGWCTGSEVLALHQRLSGSQGRRPERDELLELVGLSDAANRRVEEMSKGMQQRLGIAQALVGEPRLLLLDEPTSALDPAGRRTIRTLLLELRSRGIAVLLNSHLLGELRASMRPGCNSRGRKGRDRRTARRTHDARRRRDSNCDRHTPVPRRPPRGRATHRYAAGL